LGERLYFLDKKRPDLALRRKKKRGKTGRYFIAISPLTKKKRRLISLTARKKKRGNRWCKEKKRREVSNGR